MISVIIPSYNEAGNIATLINQISLALTGKIYEIIVVDDNSPDKTWELVTNIAKNNRRVKLIKRLNERGLTSALNRGIQASRGEIIGWLDADLSHPPALLKKMLSYFPGFDVVVASRYVAGGADKRREHLAVILSRIINRLARFCLYRDFTDYTSGYILLKKNYLPNLNLQGDYGEYFIDLIFRLKQAGAKIKEVGYINLSRSSGQSKTTTSRGIKYLIVLLRLWLKK